MKIAIRSLPGLVAFCLGVLAVSSCGKTSSVSPTSPSLATGDNRRALSKFATTSQDALSYPLFGGSVVIENAKGHRIAGTYSGTTVFATGGGQVSSLTLQVSDGSGHNCMLRCGMRGAVEAGFLTAVALAEAVSRPESRRWS